MADDLGGRRAAIQEDRIAVFDQRGSHFANQPLLFCKYLGTMKVLCLQLKMLAQHGSPMSALDQTIFLQPFQIAAYSGLAGIQELAEIAQSCNPVNGQIRLYSFSPLGRDQ